jgi:hypothetical protein
VLKRLDAGGAKRLSAVAHVGTHCVLPRIDDRELNAWLAATILSSPSDVVSQDEVHQLEEDLLRRRSAACQPKPNRVLVYAKPGSKLGGCARDFHCAGDQTGL